MSDSAELELKTGMTVVYPVGDKIVKLKPVTLGKMKAAVNALSKKGDTFEMIEGYLVEALNNGENDFATAEWIRDNITFPMANRIINDMKTINGMSDFFPNRGKEPVKAERDLVESAQPTPLA